MRTPRIGEVHVHAFIHLPQTQLTLKVDVDCMKLRFRPRVIHLKVRETPVALYVYQDPRTHIKTSRRRAMPMKLQLQRLK